MLALTRPGALNPTPQVAFSGDKGAKCTGEACQRTATPRDATRNRSQPVISTNGEVATPERWAVRWKALSRPHPFPKICTRTSADLTLSTVEKIGSETSLPRPGRSHGYSLSLSLCWRRLASSRVRSRSLLLCLLSSSLFPRT